LKPPNASFEACKPPVWSLHSPGNQHQDIITAKASLPHLLHRSQRMMSANVRQCPPMSANDSQECHTFASSNDTHPVSLNIPKTYANIKHFH
ncbi:MAG: hypothetical protein K2O54_03145, partial [Prevotella sp.]|nr:hypothetical protein [Prevotella sp.]